MTRWWSNLSPRERLLLGIAAPLGIVALTWNFVWIPLQEDRDRLQRRIVAARTVEAALTQPEIQVAQPAPTFTETVSARVTRSADEVAISLTRIEPRDNGLTVLVDSAPFEGLLAWIADLEQNEGVTLAAISLDRRAEPGIVSARLELEERS